MNCSITRNDLKEIRELMAEASIELPSLQNPARVAPVPKSEPTQHNPSARGRSLFDEAVREPRERQIQVNQILIGSNNNNDHRLFSADRNVQQAAAPENKEAKKAAPSKEQQEKKKSPTLEAVVLLVGGLSALFFAGSRSNAHATVRDCQGEVNKIAQRLNNLSERQCLDAISSDLGAIRRSRLWSLANLVSIAAGALLTAAGLATTLPAFTLSGGVIAVAGLGSGCFRLGAHWNLDSKKARSIDTKLQQLDQLALEAEQRVQLYQPYPSNPSPSSIVVEPQQHYPNPYAQAAPSPNPINPPSYLSLSQPSVSHAQGLPIPSNHQMAPPNYSVDSSNSSASYSEDLLLPQSAPSAPPPSYSQELKVEERGVVTC